MLDASHIFVFADDALFDLYMSYTFKVEMQTSRSLIIKIRRGHVLESCLFLALY